MNASRTGVPIWRANACDTAMPRARATKRGGGGGVVGAGEAKQTQSGLRCSAVGAATHSCEPFTNLNGCRPGAGQASQGGYMNADGLFVLVTALAWYNVGTIWAHEVDIFRSWALVGPDRFPAIQAAHWRKLPYWVFIPVGVTLLGSLALLWHHPTNIPMWAVRGNAGCQVLSLILTAGLWGPWQARLSRDSRGPASPYLARILASHWIRTMLITAGGGFLLIALGALLRFA